MLVVVRLKIKKYTYDKSHPYRIYTTHECVYSTTQYYLDAQHYTLVWTIITEAIFTYM